MQSRQFDKFYTIDFKFYPIPWEELTRVRRRQFIIYTTDVPLVNQQSTRQHKAVLSDSKIKTNKLLIKTNSRIPVALSRFSLVVFYRGSEYSLLL